MAEDADNNGNKTTTDPPTADPSTQDDASQQASVPPADSDLLASELLHAAHVLPPDMIANVETTLDHLSATVDLFDVPPFDFGDMGGDFGDTGGDAG